jgi:hypothetical protein
MTTYALGLKSADTNIVSYNTDHFINIESLKILNWVDIDNITITYRRKNHEHRHKHPQG